MTHTDNTELLTINCKLLSVTQTRTDNTTLLTINCKLLSVTQIHTDNRKLLTVDCITPRAVPVADGWNTSLNATGSS